jgi:hypothetical protein
MALQVIFSSNPSGVRQTSSDYQALSDLENRVCRPSFPFSSGITRLADEKNDFTVILVTPRSIAPQMP